MTALKPYKPTPAIEAIAEAWASIDGKLKQFQRGKRSPAYDNTAGYYMGYLADAEALENRLRLRGFRLARMTKP